MRAEALANLVMMAAAGAVVGHFHHRHRSARERLTMLEHSEPSPVVSGLPVEPPNQTTAADRIRALTRRGYRVEAIETPYGTVVLKAHRRRRPGRGR